jgi:hypothetical protein
VLKLEKFDNLPFEAFTGLEELHLIGKMPENCLLALPELKTLKIEDTESFDIRSLSPCRSLRNLSVETQNLANGLTGLESLKGLRSLALKHSDTGFENLAPLAHCGELESLTLEYTGDDTWKVQNIGELARLTGLKDLDLDNCTFDDSRFIKGLSSLTDIKISQNDRLAELHLPDDGMSLNWLSIYMCRSLESIVTGRLPRELEKFHVDTTAIRRLPSLTGVETILDCRINRNKNLADLDEMKSLSSVNRHIQLDLRGCRGLKDISGISNLRLAMLVLDTARIPKGSNVHVRTLVMEGLKSLAGIGRFPSLRNLNIRGNEYLRELTDLRDAVRVVTLKAAKCPSITSLEGLQHLKELDYLDIVDMRNLKDIGAVKGLTIGNMFIAGSNFKKADFPPHLQPSIDSTSKPY